MYELALFAGAGGGILGGVLNGWRCIGAVECEGYPRGILAQRQNDGMLHPFPIWDDVRTFRADNAECAGYIEWLRSIAGELVITGGFPCQDISAAGKGAGITGERSGLWREFARIIGEVGPRHVLVENSPVLTSRGLGVVLGDLATLGYDARWGVLGAADAGAPHKRDRIWIVAVWARGNVSDAGHRTQCERSWSPRREAGERKAERGKPDCDGEAQSVADADERRCDQRDEAERRISLTDPRCDEIRHADEAGCEQQRWAIADGEKLTAAECSSWWESEPDVGRVAHGVAARVDRLAALGNGQVPAVVRMAWGILSEEQEGEQTNNNRRNER